MPRCVPAEAGTDYVVCKPTAQAAALLPDGRIFYYNGLEAWENARGSTFTSAGPSSHDSQARLLDLRSGTSELPQRIPRALPLASAPTTSGARD